MPREAAEQGSCSTVPREEREGVIATIISSVQPMIDIVLYMYMLIIHG